MTSPFASDANADLVFKVPATGSSSDPMTGNKVVNRQEILVKAMLNAKRNSGSSDRVERLPGVDVSAVYLEGVAVDPMQLPVSIKPNTWATATWAGRQGKFLILLTAPDSYGASISVGQKIKGWFQLA